MAVFLTVEEAASFLHTTKHYIYKLAHERKLPCYKPNGGRLFFDQNELEKYIRAGRQSTYDELSQRATDCLNMRGTK